LERPNPLARAERAEFPGPGVPRHHERRRRCGLPSAEEGLERAGPRGQRARWRLGIRLPPGESRALKRERFAGECARVTVSFSQRLAVALAAASVALLACARREAAPEPVTIRNPEYLVVRSIHSEADAEHTIRVDLPYAGAGYGYASTSPLFDLTAVDIAGATFAGGRTSLAGEATIWLPLTAERRGRL